MNNVPSKLLLPEWIFEQAEDDYEIRRLVLDLRRYPKRVAEYERKLLEVQMLIDKVSGEREIQVLNWMLDGRSKRWIGQNMGLSHTHIKNIKDQIVEQMSQ
ncbi:hypothetical protein [Lysinibacillus xylanilyticus]|uniref:hypothetical protein n=1 Tax=Lysinibacillus xylanilyticus TaxID=582475 RepID=UPI0037F27CD4